MSAPSQIIFTLLDNSTVAVPIPAALQSLDSSSNQNASAQTGYNAVDQLIRSTFRAGVFFDGVGTWRPVSQIKSATWS